MPYGLSGQLMPTFSLDQMFNMVEPKNQELFDELIALGFKPAATGSVEPLNGVEIEQETTTEDESDDENDTLTTALKLLLDAGRLPNSAEVAYRSGDLRRAYQLYKAS